MKCILVYRLEEGIIIVMVISHIPFSALPNSILPTVFVLWWRNKEIHVQKLKHAFLKSFNFLSFLKIEGPYKMIGKSIGSDIRLPGFISYLCFILTVGDFDK